MLKKLGALSMLGLILLAGCAKEGPMGPAGPKGDSGSTLLAQYANTDPLAVATTTPVPNGEIDSNGVVAIKVSEIAHQINTTYCVFYYTDSTGYANNTWYPVADGDGGTSSSTAPYVSIDWANGYVYYHKMQPGDYYLFKVFEHD